VGLTATRHGTGTYFCSGIKTLADLKGKKIGVAGGPLDKSWLLLQGMAKQEHDFDLKTENEIAFGAPPLLAEKTRQGELDAMLNFWHYNAMFSLMHGRLKTPVQPKAL